MDELPRLIHDELLHRVDEPLERGLERHVKVIDPRATIAVESDDEEPPPTMVMAIESTPLLVLKAGRHHVEHLDPHVDLKALAAELDGELQATALADRHADPRVVAREELPLLVVLAIPLMLAAMLESVPSTVLNMMVGRSSTSRSTEILAASSLANMFQNLLISAVLSGLGSAADTLCSHAFGGRRLEELWVFAQAGLMAFAGLVPLMAVVLLNGATILRAIGQDPAISEVAGTILVINLLGLPFAMLYSVIKSALQAQNIVAPCVRTSVLSWIVALPMAYALGFRTPLGYIGVLSSTIVSNAIKSLALLPVVYKNPAFLAAWPGWQLRRAHRLLPKLATLGQSCILMITFQLLGISAVSMLAGLLPQADVMVSANTILQSILGLTVMPLLGITIAGAVRMGNALGAGRPRRAATISKLVMALSVGTAVVCTVITSVVARPWTESFTTDARARRVGLELIDNMVPMIPLLGINFGLESIFRASGQQWLCAKINLIFNFGIGSLAGAFFGFYLRLGVVGLWYGHMLGLLTFTTSGLAWLHYGADWEAMAHEARRNTHLHVENEYGEEQRMAAAA